jgi:hypothetical protein
MKTPMLGSRRRLPSCIRLLSVITVLIAGFTSEHTGIAQIATPPTAGLVGWWKGDGDAKDSSGLGHDGTIYAGVTFAAGLSGQAFSFGPTGNRVVIPDSPDFELTNALTMGAWVYPTANSWGIFGRFIGANVPYSLTMNNAGGVGMGLQSAGVIDNLFTPIVYQTWTQVTATWDAASGEMRVYLNGVLATNKTTSIIPAANFNTNNPGVVIGNGDDGGFPFVGLIEDVVLYSRVLSPAEIASLASTSPSPTITTQPTNQTVYSGTTVTLSVAATGSSPDYLWYKNGQPLFSATNSSLMLTNVSSADEGNYAVVVSNPFGVVASQTAQLSVAKLSSTLGLYPGITITGFIGSTLEIDYTLDLNNTNSGWTSLGTITLTNTTQLWIDQTDDVSSGKSPRRFYRVVPRP